jgi:hypothetical protein
VVPATVVAAASFDDAIAITGYTIFINLAVSPNTSPGWSIAHGPLSLVFGVIGGVAAAVFCACTKLWNTNTKRTAVLFIVGGTWRRNTGTNVGFGPALRCQTFRGVVLYRNPMLFSSFIEFVGHPV